MQAWQEQADTILRRLETTVDTISKSVGSMSGALNQVQNDVTKTGGSSGSIQDTLRTLGSELRRLENALKEHVSTNVETLSESILGRGGFWPGIWLVISVQVAGWVIYEIYRDRKDYNKKYV
jgi:ABC-type transporter Mla subunit MlaD